MVKKMSLDTLKKGAVAITVLAIVTVIGIVVLSELRETFTNTSSDEYTTVSLFITGLKVFATFIGIVAIAIVGKFIIGLFADKGM
jgi:hypothetical protein